MDNFSVKQLGSALTPLTLWRLMNFITGWKCYWSNCSFKWVDKFICIHQMKSRFLFCLAHADWETKKFNGPVPRLILPFDWRIKNKSLKEIQATASQKSWVKNSIGPNQFIWKILYNFWNCGIYTCLIKHYPKWMILIDTIATSGTT